MRINKNKTLIKMKEEIHLAQIKGKSNTEIEEIRNKYFSLLKELDYRQKDQSHKTMIAEGRKIKESFTESISFGKTSYLNDIYDSSEDEDVRREASIYNSDFIPESFYFDKSLHVKEIKIIRMNIKEISTNIEMFKNATVLKIIDCPLLQCLPNISNMNNLKYLIVNKCPLIEKVNIQNNKLVDLVITKCGTNDLILKNMKLINLSVKECPELKHINIQKLNNLVNVDLSYNQITNISSLMNCKQLEKLICRNRYRRTLYPLRSINDDTFFIPSKSLIVFIGNHPSKKSMTEENKVKRIIIHGIKALKDIPKEIRQLKKLKELDLGGNLIESIPKELVSCKNLKYVNLENNNIKDLNEGISLFNVQKINLMGNKIEVIENYFTKLSELWNLDLRYNNLKLNSFNHQLFNDLTEVKAHDFHIPFKLEWKKRIEQKKKDFNSFKYYDFLF